MNRLFPSDEQEARAAARQIIADLDQPAEEKPAVSETNIWPASGQWYDKWIAEPGRHSDRLVFAEGVEEPSDAGRAA